MSAIILNGKPHDINGQTTLMSLLASLNINPKQVAVAVNGEVVPRDTWADAKVAEGDTVEIVRAVGGGAHVATTKKESAAMDALLLLLTFAAALMVSVTVTYGAVVLFMTARYLAGGGLNLRVPTEPLLYLFPLAVVVVLAFFGLMRGFEWYHFLGGLAGAVIVLVVAYAGPRVGIAATTAAVVFGQMCGAIVYDHLGLLEQAKDPIDAVKILGALLIIAGVFLVRGF